MRKIKIMIIMFSLFLVINAGCGLSEEQILSDKSAEEEIVESSVEDISEQSLEKENIERLQIRSSEEEVSEETSSEEVEIEMPKVEIDYNNLIDERKALDLAYDYLYGEEHVYNEYSVYCDEIYHQGVPRWGYEVVQFAYDDDSTIPKYEKYDPNAELQIGMVSRVELLYDGMSANELFYTFWLCGYIDHGDWSRRSTYNFIAVSIDGKIIERERIDETGTDEWLEHWDWYYNLTTQ